VQCILQQMHELRPFPVPAHHKVLPNRFFAWCELGTCRARCCALSLALASEPSHGGIGRVDSTRVSQLNLRDKATEPAPNPLIQIMIEVCNHAKGGTLFQSGCQGIQAVVVDHVTGAFSRSAKHQQTCNHAPKQAANQNNSHKALKQCKLCVHWWHAGVFKSASVRAMGRLAFGPGRADGAVAFIQVACSIYQGYTSRFPGYISKTTMLLVSESGESKKIRQNGEKPSFWTFDLGVEGVILTVHIPKNIVLGCIKFQKRAQRTFPSSCPSAFNPKECVRFGCR
jgi:hypothetical protein